MSKIFTRQPLSNKNFRSIGVSFFLIIANFVCTNKLSAQSFITNTTPLIQNFDGIGASTVLPSFWRISPQNGGGAPTYGAGITFTTQVANSGSPANGGRYNWGNAAGTDRSLGVLSSASYASPTSIMASYQNTSGTTITSLTISYDIERYRINTAAASVQFFYSLNGGSTWLAVTAGDITFSTGASAYGYPLDVTSRSGVVISGLNVGNLGLLHLRWNLNTTGVNSQGIGLDNVSVTAGFAAPTINLTDNVLSGFTYVVGAGPSASQTINVSAANLATTSGNITITAPTNYEVSLDNINFSPSLTLAFISRTLASTPFYIRLKAGLIVGTYNSEIITVSGGGASNESITCNGSVTNFFNSLSDVVAVAASESATISSTQNDNAPLTISTGVQVWSFTIRDGGASAPDADNLPTIVNAITIAQATGNSVSNWSQAIKTISLFDGASLVATATVTDNQIQFTGMSLSVADNTSTTLTMRLSLNCGIGGANSDGDDFVFSLSNFNFTTASSATSSQKTAFAARVSANSTNVIDVVATRLIYSQQPQTNVSINNNFSPAVSVTAVDACGNVDRGFTSAINITSTGTMISTPQTAFASFGVVSFPGIIHTVVGGPFTLTATSGILTQAISNPFNVLTSTQLNPGDLMIVGYDNYVGDGTDIISIATFVPILPNTPITLANAVYDWKAPANVKQDRWYDGNNTNAYPNPGTFNQLLPSITITYTGASTIAAGSIICITLNNTNGTFSALSINGTDSYSSFTAVNADGTNGKTTGSGVSLSTSNPDAIFLMQGTFFPTTAPFYFTDAQGDRYQTFIGTVFGGLQTNNNFQPFTANGWNGGPRVSRIHPSIECVAISTGISASNRAYGYYNLASPHSGTHRSLISSVANAALWTRVNNCSPCAGDDLTANPTCADANKFTISTNVSAGKWVGGTTDWFNCANWDDFSVPTSNTDVLIDLTSSSNVVIDYTSPRSGPYDSIATAKSVTINGRNLSLAYSGPVKTNTLNVAGNITINTSTVGIGMDDAIAGTTDGTINIGGNWTNNFSNGLRQGEGLVNFNGTTGTQTITAPEGVIFNNLSISNTSTGVSLANNNDYVSVNNILNLSNGTLAINTNTLYLIGTLSGSGTITGSSTSNLTFAGFTGGSIGTLNFTAGSRLLNNFTMNLLSSTALVTLGTDLAINNLATINSGTLNVQTNSFSGTGGLTMTGGELQVGRSGVTSPELSGTYSLTGGVVNFTGSGSQTIRAVNYNNLTSTSTGARIMASSGTIGIANTFTKGTNAYTFTGSTIDYNGTTANQNITPFTAAAAPGSTYNNLTLSNSLNTITTKTLTAATDVEGDLTLNNSISLRLGANFLNLKSTATKTARVAPVSPTASIDYSLGVGRFVVERYFPGRRKWRMITAPVTVDATKRIFNSWQVGGASPVGSGTYITGLSPTGAGGNGLDASPQNNFSLKRYNSITNMWDGVANTTSASSLISGTLGGAGNPDNLGFFIFVRGDRTLANANAFNTFGVVNETTLRDTGKIQTQSYDFPGNATVGQFAVVGNPYASPVDFGSAFMGKTGIANKFYAWDPGINGTFGVGGYVVVDLALGTTTTVPAAQSGVTQTSVIQSKQAIVIETSGALPRLTFNEAAKSAIDNRNLFRPAPSVIPSVAVNLHATTASGEFVLSDGVLAQFGNDFSDGLDYLDAQKFSNINETFSIAHGNNYYMLERRKPVKANDTIFLSLRRARQLPYQFNVVLTNMASTRLAAFMEDSFSGAKTPLNMDGTTTVDFNNSIAPSANVDRFRIVFKKAFRFNSFTANLFKSDVPVQWAIETETDMGKYEVERSLDGMSFDKIGEIAASEINNPVSIYDYTDMNVAAGIYYYRVKAVSKYGAYDYSDTRKVKVVKAHPEIYVYPNPVTDGVIGLQMGNAVEGRYDIILRNAAGQMLLKKQIIHTAGALEQISYPSAMAAGTYQLEVIGANKIKTVIPVALKD